MKHEIFEKNTILLTIAILITISVGGLVQIVPLYTIDSTIEKVDGMRPYSPLELVGRNIYVREGCYLCHSQQIRPFRDEKERYGHYSMPPSPCTTTPSSGVPSVLVRTLRVLAANTLTHGMLRTLSVRKTLCLSL